MSNEDGRTRRPSLPTLSRTHTGMDEGGARRPSLPTVMETAPTPATEVPQEGNGNSKHELHDLHPVRTHQNSPTPNHDTGSWGSTIKSWSGNIFGGGRNRSLSPWRRDVYRTGSHPALETAPRRPELPFTRQSYTVVDINNPREISLDEYKQISDPSRRRSWSAPSSPAGAPKSFPSIFPEPLDRPSQKLPFPVEPTASSPSTETRPSTELSSDVYVDDATRPPALCPQIEVRRVLPLDRVRQLEDLEDPSRVAAIIDDIGPLSYRKSPWELMHRDLVFFLQHFWAIPRLFGGADGPATPLLDNVGHLVMVFISSIITVLCLAVFLAGLALVILLLYLFAYVSHSLQGPRIRHSKASRTLNYGDGKDVEKWFFINGIATTGSGAQAVIDYLHEETGRPVTAIHNRTLGAWFDLVECILMRDLHLNTANIRNGYKYIYKAIADPKAEKVVLVAHSQGGIIASAWVDQLVTDFSREMLRKLEVYTFASAADHFSRGARPEKHQSNIYQGRDGLFGRIEHFANTGDFVAQYGVLNPDVREAEHKTSTNGNGQVRYGRFTGRVFSRQMNGHSLLGHYLCSGNPENSFLRMEGMDQWSRLAAYRDGNFRVPHHWSCMVDKAGKLIANSEHYPHSESPLSNIPEARNRSDSAGHVGSHSAQAPSPKKFCQKCL